MKNLDSVHGFGKFIIGAIVAMTLAILASCQAQEKTPETTQSSAAQMSAEQYAQECRDKGGNVISGLLAQPMCQMPTPDAGKSCTASTQCSGMCLANEAKNGGTCAPYDKMFGCHGIFENGRTIGLCMD